MRYLFSIIPTVASPQKWMLPGSASAGALICFQGTNSSSTRTHYDDMNKLKIGQAIGNDPGHFCTFTRPWSLFLEVIDLYSTIVLACWCLQPDHHIVWAEKCCFGSLYAWACHMMMSKVSNLHGSTWYLFSILQIHIAIFPVIKKELRNELPKQFRFLSITRQKYAFCIVA